MSDKTLKQQKLKLQVLLACHNRIKLTRAICQQLKSIAASTGFEIEIFAVDDGSTDGTFEFLNSLDICLGLHRGDGSYFWARSMQIAEQLADVSERQPGYKYLKLWLNDDVVLDEAETAKLVTLAVNESNRITIGAMQSKTGAHSYGAFKRVGLMPLKLTPVVPSKSNLETIDTFNGNFVLYDDGVTKRVGGIDGEFSHSLADIDFGFRAKAALIDIVQHPGYIGFCERNSAARFESRRAAWRFFISAKGGGNPASLKRILKKRTAFWRFYILITYSLWWVRRIIKREYYLA